MPSLYYIVMQPRKGNTLRRCSPQDARHGTIGGVAYIHPEPPASGPPMTSLPPPATASAPSGWTCPGCGHSYAPWVPECHHCPQGGAT